MSLAADFTGLKIEHIDGVTEVNDDTLPLGGKDYELRSGELGNWRAHMDALRT